jgi:hypothetical protein
VGISSILINDGRTLSPANRKVAGGSERPKGTVTGGASRYRDTSLVALIPKWTGADKGVPLEEFLEAVEIAARIRNWTDADMVQITILRLICSARVFMRGIWIYIINKLHGQTLERSFSSGSGTYEPTSFISRSCKRRLEERTSPFKNSRTDEGP